MSNTTENTGKQLGQLRPADTNAASLYSPAAGVIAEIEALYVCNQTSGALTFRVFHDNDGTTYDETTALYFDVSVAANITKRVPDDGNLGVWMDKSTGNFAVRSSANDGFTFTLYGIEHTRKAKPTFPRNAPPAAA